MQTACRLHASQSVDPAADFVASHALVVPCCHGHAQAFVASVSMENSWIMIIATQIYALYNWAPHCPTSKQKYIQLHVHHQRSQECRPRTNLCTDRCWASNLSESWPHPGMTVHKANSNSIIQDCLSSEKYICLDLKKVSLVSFIRIHSCNMVLSFTDPTFKPKDKPPGRRNRGVVPRMKREANWRSSSQRSWWYVLLYWVHFARCCVRS